MLWLPSQVPHIVIRLSALSIILEPTTTRTVSEEVLAWYNQQQHILIIVSNPWDLEVNLHKPKVWDGCTPCPI